jgi:RNA-splicing ligase RtcB
VHFPRLKTMANDLTHEMVMRRLIEREDRLLASKQIAANRFKHKEFMEYLSRVKPNANYSQPNHQ